MRNIKNDQAWLQSAPVGCSPPHLVVVRPELRGPLEGPGASWEVLERPRSAFGAFLGGLGGLWGLSRRSLALLWEVLGVPGLLGSLEVSSGVDEVVLALSWEVNLVSVQQNIDMFEFA